MARFAPRRSTVRALLRHLIVEFAVVRVLVAAGAGAILKSIGDHFCGIRGPVNCMALRAGNRQVRPRQRVAALLVLRDRVSRGLKPVDDVAGFTLALIWRRGKLALMRVRVAVQAFCKRDFVSCRRPRWQVAFRAGHGCVFARKGIRRGHMRLYVEERRLPALLVVAARTFALVRACGKLAAVRVRLVAIRALGKRNRLFEISTRVAAQAVHLRVLSQQRKFRFRVVELLARRDSFPTAGRMAAFARLRKSTAMRVTVAVRTLAEWNSRVARLPTRRRGCVAFRARHLHVDPRERIPGLRVIEFGGRFPVHVIVTIQTFLPQLAVVYIFVACDAILRKSQECAIQILHLD